jgi:hypothetical protein
MARKGADMRILRKSRGGTLSEFWRQSPQTVRPRSYGKVPFWLCLAAFCITAVVVYQWGRDRWRPTRIEPMYTATAYVVERPHKAATTDRAEDAYDQRSPPYDVCDTRLPFVFTADGPRQAAETANALADRYATNRHAQWQTEIEGPCLKARHAAEEARQDYSERTARLAQFERQLREAANAAARPKPMIEPAPPVPPPMIDNPQWRQRQLKLAELRRQREQLLVNRTPAHPAVQRIDLRIDEAEEALAAIPRQIPNPHADDRPSKAATVARADNQAAERIAQENQQKLHDFAVAVEKARQARDVAERAEKQAIQRQQAEPQLVVEYAKVVQDPLLVDYGWRRLMWSTLAASALMAFGIGGVWLGATIEPAVSSIGQVEAALRGPIIGTIPAQDPMSDSDTPERQASLRRAAITIGLLLMAACPVAAVWGIAGL